MKIQKKSLLQRLLKRPRNTRLKPYTTRMAKIQGLNEGKKPILIFTKISGLILNPWAQNYPKAHENLRAFPWISGPINLESSIQCPCGVGLHKKVHDVDSDDFRSSVLQSIKSWI